MSGVSFAQGPRDSSSPEKSPSITGVPHNGLKPFDDLMTSFVGQHRVPGAALAVTRGSKLVYARGFGFADVKAKRPVQPDSLFRIASISKPLTAVGVMQLIGQGKFKLEDRVFEVLPAGEWLPEKYDERLRSITIRQLLQHTGGWDRDKSFDPITRPHDVARVAKKPLPVNASDVARYALTLPLDFDPGTRYAYSNIDYLLLGRLIELASGLPYERYVKEKVLASAGVTRMQLGRVWQDELAEGEVRYYDSKQRNGPAVNGMKLGEQVPFVYGAENFEGYEAHGGWIASTIDLVRFASALDNPTTSKLLQRETMAAMWSRPDGPPGHEADGKPKAAFYGCGWNVRPVGNDGRANVWHGGLIAGTSTLLVRRHDGLNWAVLFNTDRNSEDKVLSGLIDPLIHQA
ncbi:MAG: beta-lactamase family protein, partial [Candidatus Saccharimonas sp.]|nr:beta-lactamase family protein [Planctomycetaceae bacterium]